MLLIMTRDDIQLFTWHPEDDLEGRSVEESEQLIEGAKDMSLEEQKEPKIKLKGEILRCIKFHKY